MNNTNIADFMRQLETELDDMPAGTLTAETNFRDLDDWSSMHALIIIAFIDAEYGVTLTAEDLKEAQTVRDIYLIVQKKQA